MKTNVNFWLGNLAQIAVLIVVLSTLFLFWGRTSEFYELPKFIILFVVTSVLFLTLAVKFVFQDKLILHRTPLDLPLLLLLIVAIVSTVTSPAPMISLFGHQPTIHTSLAAILVYVLFYLFLVNSLTGTREAKFIVQILALTGAILSVITLLSYVGIKFLPAPFVQGVNFTPTGSSFTTAAILTMLLPHPLLSLISNKDHRLAKQATSLIHIVLLILFGITIILVGTWANWVVATLVVGLTVLLTPITLAVKRLPYLLIPAILITAVAFLSFAPIPGKENPLQKLAKNFPREPQLAFDASWKVSVSTFRDYPFWGSGPDSYLYSFTTYKPLEYNNSKLWNIRFDTPFNEYLGVLANLGGLGSLALLLMTALFFYQAINLFTSRGRLDESADGERNQEDIISSTYWQSIDKMFAPGSEGLKLSLAISGVAFFATLFLYPSTLPFWIIGLILLAAFMVSSNISKPLTIRFGSTGSNPAKMTLDILPSVILLALLALLVIGSVNFGKFILADMHHRQAVSAVSANKGIDAYNELIKAEKLAPWNDLYHSDLAQLNFAIASSIASSKAPSSENPDGTLSDEDKRNIQTFLQQSIDEGRTATTSNPRNVTNWEVLASVYRQISGVAQNALVFSLDSYGRAIQRDPYNPILRLNVGGIYYAIKNYELAVRFFTDAANLKPDWANAYYNLAVALRDKGDRETAKAVATKVMELVEPKDPGNQDYQTALKLVEELSEAQLTPPAASSGDGTLEKEELPKVLDLQNPDNIATPAAIKK